jgi:hypothetical protein
VAALGRLFVEMLAKTTLPEDVQKAQDSLRDFWEEATQSGQ